MTRKHRPTPKGIARHFKKYTDRPYETLWLVACDKEGALIKVKKFKSGGRTNIKFSPLKLVEMAKSMGAEIVYIVHNHPDGDSRHSGNDKYAFEVLSIAFRVQGIRLRDSVVVASNNWSALQKGVIKEW